MSGVLQAVIEVAESYEKELAGLRRDNLRLRQENSELVARMVHANEVLTDATGGGPQDGATMSPRCRHCGR